MSKEIIVEDRLDGWSEIAGFIKRSLRQTKRRAERGMPVYKLPGGGIFAFKSEIKKWERESRFKLS